MRRLRSLLRRLGLTRLIVRVLEWPEEIRLRAEVSRQRAKGFGQMSAELCGLQIALRVDNEGELRRGLTYRRDAHLITPLIEALEHGGDGWDIGSNFGLYGLFMAAAAANRGTITAFEPVPWCRSKIEHNAVASGLGNIFVAEAALSDQAGRMRMVIPSGGEVAGVGHLVDDPDAEEEGQEIEIETYTGDGYRTRQGLPIPTAVKIDVEGYELEVVRGLRETLSDDRCKVVVVEIHSALLEQRGMADAPGEVESFLAACGFAEVRWADYAHLIARR